MYFIVIVAMILGYTLIPVSLLIGLGLAIYGVVKHHKEEKKKKKKKPKKIQIQVG